MKLGILKLASIEWAAFLLLALPCLFAVIGYTTLLVKLYPFNHVSDDDIIMLSFFWVVSFTGVPVLLWWLYVTRSILQSGHRCVAKITALKHAALTMDVTIQYSFTHNGNQVNHYANLLRTGVIKNLKVTDQITVAYLQSKDISVVLDAGYEQ